MAWSSPSTWVTLLAVTGALMAVIAPALNAVRSGWWPIEDNARVALRTLDLLGGHWPLTGAQSGAGLLDAAASAHHPGPFQFYWLAPFAAADPRAGMVIGLLVLHVLAIAASARAAWLLGGNRLLVPVMAVCIVLAHGTFYARTFEPTNTIPPLFLLLLAPLAAALVLRRRHAWVPVLAVSSSIAIQAQLAYAPILVLLITSVSVIGLVDWRRRRLAWWPVRGFTPRDIPRWRPGWVTTGLVLLLWLPPLVEILTFVPNNLTQLLRYVSSPGPTDTSSRPGFFLLIGEPFTRGVAATGAGVAGSILLMLLVSLLGRRLSREVRDRRPGAAGTRRHPTVTLPAIVVGGLIAEAAILSRTLPAGNGVWTTIYWETPLQVLALLLWATAAWLVTTWIVVVRRWSWARTPGVSVVATFAVIGGALLAFLPGGHDFPLDRVRAQIAPAEAALAVLPDAGSTPDVRIAFTGGFFNNPTNAVTYRLMSTGRRACNEFTWPVPEETDYRKWPACPKDSPALVIALRGDQLRLPSSLSGGRVTFLGSTPSYDDFGKPIAYDSYLVTFPGQ